MLLEKTTFKIKNKLFLNKISLVPEIAPIKPNHYIQIIDCSGSMYSTLPAVKQNLSSLVDGFDSTSALTLISFSSESDCRVLFKGLRLLSDHDKTAAKNIINSQLTARSTTCFSESLQESLKSLGELAPFGYAPSILFFTDGHIVVADEQKEKKAIFDTLQKLKSELNNFIAIGYGEGYNKTFLNQMSETVGGTLLHSTSNEDLKSKLDLYEAVASVGHVFQTTDLSGFTKESDILSVFTVDENCIKSYSFDKPVMHPKSVASLYVVSTTPLADVDFEPKEKELLAAAYVLSQKCKAHLALDFLNSVGHQTLIDRLGNAFTNNECGAAENAILSQVLNPQPFTKIENYLPKADAYCVLDLIDDLIEADAEIDLDSFIAGYKRTTAHSKSEGTYGEFHKETTNLKLSTLVWNESRLNLSFQATIKGKLELLERAGKKPEDLGLLNRFPCSVVRNFTFIKDGKLNVSFLPVKICGIISNKLADVLADSIKSENNFTIIDLTKLPIMNRSIAEGRTSATNLCKWYFEVLENKAANKAYKSYIKDFEEKTVKVEARISDKIEAFLQENGIVKGVFSPKKTSVVEDFYYAPTLDIKVKGFSSLPKIEDVYSKMHQTKPLTPVQKLIAKYIVKSAGLTKEDLQKLLHDSVLATRKLEREITRTKFCIILGNRWFDEFESREGCKLSLDDKEFAIEFGKEKVSI